MKLPKKISPCPILEAILEIRYSSSAEMPPSAIFGLAYDKLHNNFPKVIDLPILQLPEQIRLADPNLRNQAHHRFENDECSLSLGPKVIVFSSKAPYPGWTSFFKHIKENLDALLEVKNLIQAIERVGIRFINFFDTGVKENIDFNISTSDADLREHQFHSTIVIPDDEFKNTVQIFSKASVVNNNSLKIGTILDIDTYQEDADGKKGDLTSDLYGFIERGHDCEKKIFYTFLKTEALEKLNPKY